MTGQLSISHMTSHSAVYIVNFIPNESRWYVNFDSKGVALYSLDIMIYLCMPKKSICRL